MNYKQMTVTQQIAEKWLENNTSNRHIRQSRVEYFCDLLRRNQFLCTHQGIAIAPSGRLLDGQHRLWAIALSGVAADMMVATNVDEETFIACDRVMGRTVGDVLSLDARAAGIANYITTMASSATRTPSPDQVQKVVDIFGEEINTLIAARPGTKARVSASPIRAAIVIRMKDVPATSARLCGVYKNFVERNYEELPKSVQSFLRQIDEGTGVRNSADLFTRSWRAFDPERFSASKVMIKDRDAVLEEIKLVINRYIPESKLSAGKRQRVTKKFNEARA